MAPDSPSQSRSGACYSAFTPEAASPSACRQRSSWQVQSRPHALMRALYPAIPEMNRPAGLSWPAPVRRMMIGLMKRIAHAISGIGEKPALLTEGGLLLCPQRRPIRGSPGGPPRAKPGALRISTSARPPSRTGLAAARSVRRGSPSPPSSRGSRRRCSRSRPASRSACSGS